MAASESTSALSLNRMSERRRRLRVGFSGLYKVVRAQGSDTEGDSKSAGRRLKFVFPHSNFKPNALERFPIR